MRLVSFATMDTRIEYCFYFVSSVIDQHQQHMIYIREYVCVRVYEEKDCELHEEQRNTFKLADCE